MRPLIGITMNLEKRSGRNINSLDQDYGDAVVRAGGLPVPVLGLDWPLPELASRLDGFIFSGGDDIHPRFYQEKVIAKARMTLSPDERTNFEIKLFKAAAKAKKPILAICGGAQLVNIALGGSLYQDIRLQLPKSGMHAPAKTGEQAFHPVAIFEGTRLCRIMGDCRATGDCRVLVRSAHHQSIKNPGKGLRLSAVSPDGVFEAFEARSKTHFFIAVQWHPEKTNNDRHTKKLFEALVHASRK